ncbi:MAG: hypothetical protein ACTS42_00855 [Candidatus Hodgkinia cicadicola]
MELGNFRSCERFSQFRTLNPCGRPSNVANVGGEEEERKEPRPPLSYHPTVRSSTLFLNTSVDNFHFVRSCPNVTIHRKIIFHQLFNLTISYQFNQKPTKVSPVPNSSISLR